MSFDLDPSDGMLSRAALASELLLYRMEQLSEDFCSAAWITDLEFSVWDMAFNDQPLFGNIEVTENTVKYFRDLATLAGGWWVHGDETQADEGRPVFVTSERWQQILAEHQTNNP